MLEQFLKKKNIGIIVLFSFVFLSISFFAKESLGRYIAILVLVASFLVFFLTSKNIYLSCLAFLLLALPLNITYQFPVAFEKTLVNNIHVNYLVPTVSILDLGVFIFLLSALLDNFVLFKTVFLKYKIGILLFTFFLLIQNIFLRDILVTLNSLRFLSYLFSFLIFLEHFKISKLTKKQISILSISLLFSVMLQGFIGFLQFTKGSSIGLKFLGEPQVAAGLLGSSFVSLSGEEILRAYGTFPHPNILGGFFLLSFFLSLYFYRFLKKELRLLPILSMIFCCLFVLFTFSRSAIFLLYLSLSFLFVSLFVLRKRKILSLSMPLLSERFLSFFTGVDSGLVDRQNLLKSSFFVIKENILKGTGLGKYVQYMGENSPLTKNGLYLLQPVHNIFLFLLAEFGVFGFVSFLFLLFEILKKSIQRVNILVILISISVIGIGLVDHYLFSLPQGLVMFWVFLGLIILFSKELKKNKEDVNN